MFPTLSSYILLIKTDSPCQHTPEHAYHGTAKVDHHYRHHDFRVRSWHYSKRCKCLEILHGLDNPEIACQYRIGKEPGDRYDRCAHWFWQTQASAHLWTPEIYESFTIPITVTRIIPVKRLSNSPKFDDILDAIPKKGVPYVHFDFVATTQLRELGWRWKDYLKFNHTSNPAELRAKKDFGYPVGRDRVTFCIWACAARIRWPKFPTRELQKEANEAVRSPNLVFGRMMDCSG